MIEFNNVTFKYSGADENAIENFSLTVQKGEFVVLAGASGCGKTTVTRLLNKLIPEFYEGEFTGSVTIDGNNLSDVEIDSLVSVVGSVFQDPRSQFFATETIAEIAFSCENLNLNPDEIKKRVDIAVDKLNLHHLKGKSIFELSSGEKQSIAIASVYTLSPKILVLDEPSANLDISAVENLRKTLALLKEQGVTIIISEHRLNYLSKLANRILLFDNGKIKSEFKGDEFYKMTNSSVNALGLRSLNMQEIKTPKKQISDDRNPITLKDISFFYNKNTSILNSISLDIKKGSVVGLIGKNGAGKSTLMDIICGLQKQKSGEVYFDTKKAKPNQRSHESYLVMQNSDCQLFTESVQKELYLGKKTTVKEQQDALKILEYLNLDSLLKRHPASLSGGQKQRLAIALSCFKNTEIICMDEPTSGLDLDNMKKVSTFISKLSKDKQTFLVASHDFEFLACTCTDICYLESGEVKDFFNLNSDTLLRLLKLLYED